MTEAPSRGEGGRRDGGGGPGRAGEGGGGPTKRVWLRGRLRASVLRHDVAVDIQSCKRSKVVFLSSLGDQSV